MTCPNDGAPLGYEIGAHGLPFLTFNAGECPNCGTVPAIRVPMPPARGAIAWLGKTVRDLRTALAA